MVVCVCVYVRAHWEEVNFYFEHNYRVTDRRTDTQTEGRETARGGARRRRRGRLWFDARRGAARRRWFTQWISGNPSSLQPGGSPRGGSNHLVTPRSWDALENETTRKNCTLGASGAQRCPAFMRKKQNQVGFIFYIFSTGGKSRAIG